MYFLFFFSSSCTQFLWYVFRRLSLKRLHLPRFFHALKTLRAVFNKTHYYYLLIKFIKLERNLNPTIIFGSFLRYALLLGQTLLSILSNTARRQCSLLNMIHDSTITFTNTSTQGGNEPSHPTVCIISEQECKRISSYTSNKTLLICMLGLNHRLKSVVIWVTHAHKVDA